MLFSCKKEEQYNPDKHITYTHWYKTRSNTSDTLFTVWFPNCFSPNGDGINDTFFPLGNFYLNSFKVFGRNDQVIFETSDVNEYWHGIDYGKGYIIEMGEYVYKLDVSDAAGKSYEYTGKVMLYR